MTQTMKRYIIRIIAIISIFWLGGKVAYWNEKRLQSKPLSIGDYKAKIENNSLMPKVDSMAKAVVATGFSAGSGYGEVWIRDYNTFIELSMDVLDDELIRRNLDVFFAFQEESGEVMDGFIDIKKADLSYNYRFSKNAPEYAAHKNTVETDQESSLVQAV